jgi:hypothetical protein
LLQKEKANLRLLQIETENWRLSAANGTKVVFLGRVHIPDNLGVLGTRT